MSFQIVFMVTDAGKKKVDPRPRQSNDIFMEQPSRKLKHKSSSRLSENISAWTKTCCCIKKLHSLLLFTTIYIEQKNGKIRFVHLISLI